MYFALFNVTTGNVWNKSSIIEYLDIFHYLSGTGLSVIMHVMITFFMYVLLTRVRTTS